MQAQTEESTFHYTPTRCERCNRHVPVYEVHAEGDYSAGWYCKQCIEKIKKGEVDQPWV